MNSLQGRRIALIGGAGFIGHNMGPLLVGKGATVEVMDSLGVNNFHSFSKAAPDAKRDRYLSFISQRLELLKKNEINLVEVDSRDYHALTREIARFDPDTIIHLAAVAHAGKSNKDPYSTFDHSLRTLENALDIARSPKLNVRRFIYFSSSMVYGNFSGGVVTEDAACEPIGIYGALKYAGEKIVIAYNQVFDLPYTIVRPSALYGQRCVSRRVAQVFIENGLTGIPINIHGDGSDRLDFTYVDDLIHGIVCALTHDTAENETFNLTYGESRSIKELLEVVSQEIPGIEVQYQPRDELMPQRGTLDVSKARELIGYSPSFPIEQGLPDYVEWYRSIWVTAESHQP